MHLPSKLLTVTTMILPALLSVDNSHKYVSAHQGSVRSHNYVPSICHQYGTSMESDSCVSVSAINKNRWAVYNTITCHNNCLFAGKW